MFVCDPAQSPFYNDRDFGVLEEVMHLRECALQIHLVLKCIPPSAKRGWVDLFIGVDRVFTKGERTLTVNTSASDFLEPIGYDPEMPPKTDQLLADIKVWCEKNGVSRSELARKLGVGRSAVSDWYAQRKTPTGEQCLTMLEMMRENEEKG
jgi:predicted XRE-type DNA-binding protein